MKEYLKRNDGMAVYLVIILLFVCAILLSALFSYAYGNFRQYQLKDSVKQAEYLAETGIEAVMRAWEIAAEDIREQRDTLPTYLLKSGVFVTQRDTEAIPDEAVGFYTVHVDPNAVQDVGGHDVRTVRLTSVGYSGEVSRTVSAYKVLALDAFGAGWYGRDGAIDLSGMGDLNNMRITPGLEFAGSAADGFAGQAFPGSVVFPGGGTGFSESDPEGGAKVTLADGEKVILAGKALFFDIPISMEANISGAGNKILVLSGSDIVLGGDTELYIYCGQTSQDIEIGTVVLSVSEGYAKRDKAVAEDNAVKGKIYFNADVWLTVVTGSGSDRRKIFPRGEVCYFDGSGSGVDLIKYFLDTADTGDGIIEEIRSMYPSNDGYTASDMRKIDPGGEAGDSYSDTVPPHPDSGGMVVWD